MRSIFLGSTKHISTVYGADTVAHLKEQAGLCETVFSHKDVTEHPEQFTKTEYIFSTWGMPRFSEEEIRTCFPKLRAIFYAAGTVQSFARPFLHCGVHVFSAWAANAVPVAEYTLAQILLAGKGFFTHSHLMSQGNVKEAQALRDIFPGNFRQKVGLIGVGMIGSLVAQRLQAFDLEVMAFDPFLSEARAKELGVTICSLKELFDTCSVVSNHLANNAATQGMLNYDCFSQMLPRATFLNTGRGAQVVESDLARALTERPDLTAVLDVTFPEPPEEGHPFYSLPNCFLTPHIAGSLGPETQRMAEYMGQEFDLYSKGLPCRYEVTLKMLETMA